MAEGFKVFGSAYLTVFLLVLIPVVVVTTVFRVLINGGVRLISGSHSNWFAGIVIAHVMSLFLVGWMSTIGMGVADFPNMASVLAWSIVYVGPSQLFLFVADTFFYLWRRQRTA